MSTELEQAIGTLPHSLTVDCRFLGYTQPETAKLFLKGQHNWIVVLRYNGQIFQTSYFQGLGHALAPVRSSNVFHYHYRGTCGAPSDWRTSTTVDAVSFRAQWYADERSAGVPKVADVLNCLLSDAQAGSKSFEDFCSSFGYDTDSRKAYAAWEACRNIFIGLHVLLGHDIEHIEGKDH